MNRVVGFRQSARHPIVDLAAAEPPLRTDGFDLSVASFLSVIMNVEAKGLRFLFQIGEQIAFGKNF